MSADHRDLALEMLADAEAERRARSKALICALIAMLPCWCWLIASAIVRRLWPEMRDA